MNSTFNIVPYTNKERAIANIIQNVYTSLQAGHTPNVKNKHSDSYFGYIMTYPSDFQIILSLIYSYILYSNKKLFRLLDVGCGDGMLAMMVNRFVTSINNGKGLSPMGLDIEPPKHGYIEIEKANALSFSSYHKYDIIYSYHPIKDPSIMCRLLDTIEMGMASSSLFIFNSTNITEVRNKLPRLGMKNFISMSHIYYKIKDL